MIQETPQIAELASVPELEDLLALLDEAPELIRSGLHDRLVWLQRLLHWVRWDGSAEAQRRRFAVVLNVLRENADWRSSFSVILGTVLSGASLVGLFAGTGVPQGSNLFSEVARRMARQIEVCPPHGNDLARWLGWTFGMSVDREFFERMPRGALSEILSWLCEPTAAGCSMARSLRRSFRKQMLEALRVLGADVTSIGVLQEIRQRTRANDLSESPCLRLSFELDTLARLMAYAPDGEPCVAAQAGACLRELANARRMAAEVHSCLREFGISPGLIYKLERLSALLGRIELILRTLSDDALSSRSLGSHSAPLDREISARWLAEAMNGIAIDRQGLGLLMRCLRPLGRKVAERTAALGQKYVTRDSREHRAMLRSCGGGGLITAGTVIVKFLILCLKSSIFVGGCLISLNYMVSFLVMHALSFRLATKQSSLLGSALVTLLKEQANLKQVAHEVASVLRSLIGGIVGNVGVVAPAMIAFHYGYLLVAGRPFMDDRMARHVIETLDPVRSLTVPYAILTGGLLWLSSAFAGWMENWAIYRRIPVLLRAKGGRPGKLVSHHVSGIASSISLGLLLGVVPAVGAHFGLPLDIRHITLSTGALAAAVCTLGLGPALAAGGAWAVAGLMLIGFFNSVVSFAIGFATSMHAQRVDRAILSRGLAAVRIEGGIVLRYLVLPPPRTENTRSVALDSGMSG